MVVRRTGCLHMAWPLHNAKARLSEIARRALAEGPQILTVRGRPALVLISQAEFASLTRQEQRRPLVDVYRESPIARERLDLRRSRDAGRKVEL